MKSKKLKTVLKILAICLILGCNSKQKKSSAINDFDDTHESENLNCDGFNFGRIQKDYSLFNPSNELSNDTLEYTAKVFYKKNEFFPRHALFVALNKKGDTIFKYFGDRSVLVNSTIFKKDKNYFILLTNSKNGSYRLLQNNRYSKFFQIDTLNQVLLDIEPLDYKIFNQFFKEKMGKEMHNALYCIRDSITGVFNVHCDLIVNDTIYSVDCPLELVKNDSGKYKLSAKPEDLKKQAIRDKEMENITIARNISFGKIKGYDLVYDCENCRTASTDGITVYAKKDSVKTELFKYYGFGGDYLSEISLEYFENHPFIYIQSTHTYGHSQGRLYALDVTNLKTNYVNTLETNYKAPDSLYPRNSFGVDINKNREFTFGTWYRSENGSGEYTLTGKYNLIKVKENIYLLEPTDIKLLK